MNPLNVFKHILVKRPKRSTFNLSHDVKLTTEFANLTPFLCEEVVPGDTWKVDSNVLLRVMPLIAPVMHEINIFVHYYYVPYRLVWDEFEDFITGAKDGHVTTQDGEIVPTHPVFPRVMMQSLVGDDHSAPSYDKFGLWAPGSLADYLNYPTTESNRAGGGMYASALPLRAYQMIYNDYYRDENLIAPLDIDISSGVVETDSVQYKRLLTLRNRAWAKDYFSSALPWPSKGPQQMVPVIGNGEIDDASVLDVRGKGLMNFWNEDREGRPSEMVGSLYGAQSDNSVSGGNYLNVKRDAGIEASDVLGNYLSAQLQGQYVDPNGSNVKLDGVGFLINDLRRANAIQKWYERNARGGSRYFEMLASHFGVISDDLRLQRPEFLGGGKTPVQISDVLQTSETTAASPQGQYAGIGWSNTDFKGFKKTFKEYGVIMGIMSIMPKPAYSEGLPRGYHKFDKFDYYFPEFAHLGEQEIYNYELALRGVGHLTDTFGYAPRYAEYKYIPSRIHGDLKTTLNYWHLNRIFANQPTLSKDFVECDAVADDLNRIFAYEPQEEGDPEDKHLIVRVQNVVKARRPMPYLPDPSL